MMPATIHSERIRRAWIKQAKAKGFRIRKRSALPTLVNGRMRNVARQDAVFDVNGIVTNIKYADENWFSIGNRALENIDVFVFICNDPDTFYSIPADEMKGLAAITPSNSYDKRREFHIYPSSGNYSSHTYYSSGGRRNVSNFYQNWNIFGIRTSEPVRARLTQTELIEKRRSITYGEMCRRSGGLKLQQGMNYRPNGLMSIFLMNSSSQGKYPDTVLEGYTIIYEGHDVRRQKADVDPKKVDQQLQNRNGSPTANGLFYVAAQHYKDGSAGAEIIQVYEKKTKGEWLDRGLYRLTDAYPEFTGGRTIYRFKIEPNTSAASGNEKRTISEEEFADAVKTSNINLVKEVLTSESKSSVSRRNGQAALRRLILEQYSRKCAMCDVSDPQLLVASHIVPWSEDEACRGVLANVICLCSLQDKLFEKGRITISDTFEVMLSDGFTDDCNKSSACAAFRNITNKMISPPLSEQPNLSFLKKHRESFT